MDLIKEEEAEEFRQPVWIFEKSGNRLSAMRGTAKYPEKESVCPSESCPSQIYAPAPGKIPILSAAVRPIWLGTIASGNGAAGILKVYEVHPGDQGGWDTGRGFFTILPRYPAQRKSKRAVQNREPHLLHFRLLGGNHAMDFLHPTFFPNVHRSKAGNAAEIEEHPNFGGVPMRGIFIKFHYTLSTLRLRRKDCKIKSSGGE